MAGGLGGERRAGRVSEGMAEGKQVTALAQALRAFTHNVYYAR